MIVYALAILLFLVGLYGVLVKRNLFKILIGLSIMEYAINLLFSLIGYRSGGVPPILTESMKQPVTMVDPIPQALVLTAIVIGLEPRPCWPPLALGFTRNTTRST